MEETKYICDKCKLIIDGLTTPEEGDYKMAGGGELCTLIYQGKMGHNGFLKNKHYHYYCFCDIVNNI